MNIKIILLNKIVSKITIYSIILLTISLTTLLASSGIAQNKSVKDVYVEVKSNYGSVNEVFKTIEDQTKYRFAYSKDNFTDSKDLNIRSGKRNVYDVLIAISQKKNLKFTQINNSISVEKKMDKSDQGVVEIEQAITITGKVTNEEDGEGLPGVNIIVKGTVQGTITDVLGNYKLDVPDESTVLVFSSVGFIRKEVTVGNRAVIDIILTLDFTALEEVVVIGYGTVKKSDLTGAVSSLKAEDLPGNSSPNVAALLSGKVPGLTANINSAQPGGSVSILIRGAASTGAGNDPLVVIDGFPVVDSGTEAVGALIPGFTRSYSEGSRSFLNSLNINDIESIEVLKDASATAIYGARAANGVILITTKRGREGIEVSYSGSYAFQSAGSDYDFLNAHDMMIEKNRSQMEKWLFDNNITPYGTVDPNSVVPFDTPFTDAEIAAAGEGTDWFGAITETGTIQEHNISIRAGNERTKYMMSFNYFDQQGIISNTGLKRYTGRINLDQKLTNWLDFSISATLSHINNQNAQLGDRINDEAGIITSAYLFPPYLSIKDANGDFTLSSDIPNLANPVSFLDISDETINNKGLVISKLTAKIIEGLTINASIGFDNKSARRSNYIPTTQLYGALVGGSGSQEQINDNSLLLESTVNYVTKLNNSWNLTALAGWSYQTFVNSGFRASNQDFITDLFLANNLGAGVADRPGVSSWKSSSELVSYFGRVNLNYESKYLLTVTMRADGSDKFGENNKYGYFPSAALAWRLIEEDFLRSQNTLSNLKLRVSYGQTGNSNIRGDAFALYSAGSNYLFGGSIASGVRPSQIANPDLKWETTTELNLGLDFGLFNGRIQGTLEYFNKEVSDLLDIRSLPSFAPVNSVFSNIGITESKGFELLLQTLNLDGEFKWNTDITFATFKDKWKERNPDVILSVFQSEKDDLHSIFGFLSDGIVQIGDIPAHLPGAVPGDLNIRDVNGQAGDGTLTGQPDGIIDDADQVILGSGQPAFMFGFNNSFSYKRFDLNIYAYGEYNRDRFNDTRSYFTTIRSGTTNLIEESKNRWASDFTEGTLPSGITTKFAGNTSDLFMENAGFLRLRNVTLGYNIPGGKLFNSLRIYTDLQNLLVITSYTGGDPESDSFSAYPFPKTYKLGVIVNF